MASYGTDLDNSEIASPEVWDPQFGPFKKGFMVHVPLCDKNLISYMAREPLTMGLKCGPLAWAHKIGLGLILSRFRDGIRQGKGGCKAWALIWSPMCLFLAWVVYDRHITVPD